MRRIFKTLAFVLMAAGAFALTVKVSAPEITDLALTKGKIFVLSRKLYKVYIYTMDGKLIKEFGKKGTGPGDFKHSYRIYIVDGELYLSDTLNKRFQVFDLSGNFKRSIVFEHFPIVSAVPFKDVIFFSTSSFGPDRKMIITVYRKGKEEKEIIKVPGPALKGMELVYPPESFPALVRVGDAVALVELGPARVKIYKKDGSLLRAFELPLSHHKVTKEWKKKFLEEEKRFVEMVKARGMKLTFRDEFPKIEKTYSFGRCFVVKEWTPDAPHIYHIYTAEGKEVKKLTLKESAIKFIYPYWIQVNETDDGNEIILHEINAPACSE